MGICRIQKPTSAKTSHGKLFAQIICNGVAGEEYDFDAIKGDLRLHLICEEEESATFYFGKENGNDTKIMELENKIINLETMINTILSGSECNCKCKNNDNEKDGDNETEKDDDNEIILTQGLYIADGSGSNSAIYIYENDNGNVGASVDNIAKDDWLKLQHYAPEIEIAITSVFAELRAEGFSVMEANCIVNNEVIQENSKHQKNHHFLTELIRFGYNICFLYTKQE